ncbi:hypothetical protein [Pandoravirus japonicus]|uniref:Uncharacterized protein n=1 Tax=Pandoravirus japonicus TaxID=2823154 RepID=A0A811BS38_9VIRU|nr:hypothetical protein [Pandoravirus japonicus]
MQRPSARAGTGDIEDAHYLESQRAFAKSDFWDRSDPRSFLYPKSDNEGADREATHYLAPQQTFAKGDFWDRPDPKSFLYPCPAEEKVPESK